MKKTIVVFGATGNLGGKIVSALLTKGANVIAIVRKETDNSKIVTLQNKGVKVFQVNMMVASEIAKHCIGADCAVSAISGLKETIIDSQKIIVDAVIAAKVTRFIPSDYAIDFTNLVPGRNRNLDLRRDFHQYLDTKPIKPTTIFNGVFMDLLTTDMPLILWSKKRILCWGNPNQNFELTTTLNIAEFTAEAALDNDTPRFLRIAGDVMCCNSFVALLSQLTKSKYKLFRPGGITLFNVMIKLTRVFSPSKNELYPAWQGMQYMRDMMEGRVVFQKYDNDRYANINWTTSKDFLEKEPKLK